MLEAFLTAPLPGQLPHGARAGQHDVGAIGQRQPTLRAQRVLRWYTTATQ